MVLNPLFMFQGHASAEELKLLLNLVRPKFFVPIHGEYRQLHRHAELAKSLHAVGDRVLVAENGDRIQLSEQAAEINGRVSVGRIFIDEGSLDELEEVVVRDRRHLSEDGIVLPILAINKASGKMETQPEIITRGFVFVTKRTPCWRRLETACCRRWTIPVWRREPTGPSSRRRFARTCAASCSSRQPSGRWSAGHLGDLMRHRTGQSLGNPGGRSDFPSPLKRRRRTVDRTVGAWRSHYPLGTP